MASARSDRASGRVHRAEHGDERALQHPQPVLDEGVSLVQLHPVGGQTLPPGGHQAVLADAPYLRLEAVAAEVRQVTARRDDGEGLPVHGAHGAIGSEQEIVESVVAVAHGEPVDAGDPRRDGLGDLVEQRDLARVELGLVALDERGHGRGVDLTQEGGAVLVDRVELRMVPQGGVVPTGAVEPGEVGDRGLGLRRPATRQLVAGLGGGEVLQQQREDRAVPADGAVPAAGGAHGDRGGDVQVEGDLLAVTAGHDRSVGACAELGDQAGGHGTAVAVQLQSEAVVGSDLAVADRLGSHGRDGDLVATGPQGGRQPGRREVVAVVDRTRIARRHTDAR